MLCLNMSKNAPVIELVRNHWWVYGQLCEEIVEKYGLASIFLWAYNHLLGFEADSLDPDSSLFHIIICIYIFIYSYFLIICNNSFQLI